MAMRVLQSLLAGFLGVVLSGCTESLVGLRPVPGTPALTGEWRMPRDDIGEIGWYQKALTFFPDGRFASTSASYGLYEGQQRDDPSAWTRIEGLYRVEGNRLYFEPISHSWWDQFEAASFPAPRQAPYPWATLFDDATFVVTRDSLRVRFNVYPADAPLPVVAEYVRATVRD